VLPAPAGTSPYFGCVAGRFANRIAGGQFSLDGKSYTLKANNGRNHLHGGERGFDKRHWVCQEQTDSSVTLAMSSEDGDEGYPGALLAKVTYSLPSPTTLKIEYEAMADAPTIVNLTNHTYWNLRDGGLRSVADHRVQLAASLYTPTDDESIPTGEIRKVSGPMDLTKPVAMGAGLKGADNGNGYDHNFVLTSPAHAADGLRPCARVWEPQTGRWMSVRTDQPGVQFYTGNFLNGQMPGRGNAKYHRHSGFCLETQHFPDSPNQPHFPSTVLRRGQVYRHVTVHEFGASATPPTGPIAAAA
jgi:aldose 1-epimerase